jgi:recombination protein RecA
MKKMKIEESKPEKNDELSHLIEAIHEKYGEEAIMRLGEKKTSHVSAISTGSFSLDLALGVGGFPRGRIVEVYGPEMSGKSTLALHVVAEAQKAGLRAAFIDAEHALDPAYAKKIGVNISDLLISQPNSGEEALNIMESLVRSGIIGIVVIDSVAALTPRAEIEGEMGDHFIGLQARLIGQAMRKITALADKTQTLLVFINQIREKIGMMGYGEPTTTPGGRALKFFSSARVELKRIAQIKKGEEVVGNRTRAKVVKNKLAAPFKIAEFDVLYGEGISYEGDLISTALKYKTVSKTGNTYSFEGEKLGVGFDASRQKLKEDSKLLKEIEKKTRLAIEEEEKTK